MKKITKNKKIRKIKALSRKFVPLVLAPTFIASSFAYGFAAKPKNNQKNVQKIMKATTQADMSLAASLAPPPPPIANSQIIKNVELIRLTHFNKIVFDYNKLQKIVAKNIDLEYFLDGKKVTPTYHEGRIEYLVGDTGWATTIMKQYEISASKTWKKVMVTMKLKDSSTTWDDGTRDILTKTFFKRPNARAVNKTISGRIKTTSLKKPVISLDKGLLVYDKKDPPSIIVKMMDRTKEKIEFFFDDVLINLAYPFGINQSSPGDFYFLILNNEFPTSPKHWSELKVKISILDKTKNVWSDGTNAPVEKIFNYTKKIVKPSPGKILSKKDPLTTTTPDGEFQFHLDNFDKDTMQLLITTMMPITGKMNSYIYKSLIDKSGNGEIKNITKGQVVLIDVVPKKSWIVTGGPITWMDGTVDPQTIIRFNGNFSTTYVGLKKPIINPLEATTSSVTEAEIKIHLTNFDRTKMTTKIDHSLSPILNSKYDSKSQILVVKVNGLGSPINFGDLTVSFEPKIPDSWTDGTKQKISKTMHISDFMVGIPSLGSLQITKHTSSMTSHDGEMLVSASNYKAANMTIKTSPGVNAIYDPTSKKIKITNIAFAQNVTVELVPKSGLTWLSGIANPKVSATMTTLIPYPSKIATSKSDPTTVSGNGTIDIDPFTNPSSGAKLQYTTDGTSWIDVPEAGKHWTGGSGFYVDFKWALDSGYAWTSSSKIAPPTKQTLNAPSTINTLPIIHIIETKIPTPKAIGSIEITSFKNPLGAKLQYKTNGTPIWVDLPETGTVVSGRDGTFVEFKWINTSKYVFSASLDVASKTPSKVTLTDPAGLTKPVISPIETTISSTKKAEITIHLANFDLTTMDFSMGYPTPITGAETYKYDKSTAILTIANLSTSSSSGGDITVSITLKPKQYWADGTNTNVSKTIHLNDFLISIPRFGTPKITNHTSSKTAHDGEMTINIIGYDSAKMKIVSSPGVTATYNATSKTIQVTNIAFAQNVNIEIIPKGGLTWSMSVPNPKVSATMTTLIPYPSKIATSKSDPTTVSGNGTIDIDPFTNPSSGAKLQYTTDGTSWIDVPEAGKHWTGINAFYVDFKWALDSGYAWTSSSKIAPPTKQTLNAPSTINVLPNINVLENKIPMPKGSGSIEITSFKNPLGAKLQYKTNGTMIWFDLPETGTIISGKDGTFVEFKWINTSKYVFSGSLDVASKTPNKVTLTDPVDNTPPNWIRTSIHPINNASLHSTVSPIASEKLVKLPSNIYEKKYKATVTSYIGETISLHYLESLFTANDKYGGPKTNHFSEIGTPPSSFVVGSKDQHLILEAQDLFGNKSQIDITIRVGFQEVNVNHWSAGNAMFQKSFDGHGILSTQTVKSGHQVPILQILDKNNRVMDLETKHVHLMYRVVNAAGNSISWIGVDGTNHSGWISKPSLSGNLNYGVSWPKNLSNGEKIQVKLLPSIGYKLIDNKQGSKFLEVDPKTHKPNTKNIVTESHIFEYTVSGLVSILTPPTIEQKFVFSGQEGFGNVKVIPQAKSLVAQKKATMFVQWIRPFKPTNLPANHLLIDSQKNPLYGYQVWVSNSNDGQNGNWETVASVANTFSDWSEKPNVIRTKWTKSSWSGDINNPFDANTKNTLIDASTITKLHNFDTLRTVQKAKLAFGYRWEDSHTPNIDINVVKDLPNSFVSNILAVGNNLYFGERVEGLKIEPKFDISNLMVQYKPTAGNSSAYEHEAIVVPSFIPQVSKGDAYHWRYQILDKNKNVISPWSISINQQSLINGNKLVIGYAANSGYSLPSKFLSMVKTIEIVNLKHKLDISSISRPLPIVTGYIGEAIISNIKAAEPTKIGFVKVGNAILPSPKISSGVSPIRFMYRTFNINPHTLAKDVLKKITWFKNPPKNLGFGDWIEMKIAPVDETINGVEPAITSGFIQVKGLEINVNNLTPISIDVRGDIVTNILEVKANSPDLGTISSIKSLAFEASKDGKVWHPFNAFSNKLKDGMKLSYRATAKDNAIASLPAPSSSNEVVEISGKRYFVPNKWQNVTINVKTTIHVGKLKISKPQLKAMKNTPWTNFVGINKNTEIGDEFGTLKSQILDANELRNVVYYDKHNVAINAGNKISIQYRVKILNDDGTFKPKDWSLLVPKNLKNGDIVEYRLASKDPQHFILSSHNSSSMIIQGLYTNTSSHKFSSPIIISSGENHRGIAILSSKPNRGYSYAYKVISQDGKTTRLDWSNTLPTNLSNGEKIIARTYVSLNKINDETKPHIDKKPFLVSNLTTDFKTLKGIDLSNFYKVQSSGHINHKATVSDIDDSLLKTLQGRGFTIKYTKMDKNHNVIGTYSEAPKNFSNNDVVQLNIIDKNNHVMTLSNPAPTFEFKGLVEEEPHTKALSKAIIIPLIIIGVLSIIGIPLYFVMRKRKNRI